MKSSNHENEMASRGEAFGLWRLWQTRKLVLSSGITLYFHSSFRNADCGTISPWKRARETCQGECWKDSPLPITPAPKQFSPSAINILV